MSDMILNTINSLEKNGFDVYHISTKEEIFPIINDLIKNDSVVSFGGSMTLVNTGVLDYLREKKEKKEITLLDRTVKGLTSDDVEDIYRKTFSADFYFCSSNAITSDGKLYNVDGNCNRIAAMLFGPKNVVVIASTSKIVKDSDEAIERVRTVAAPQNCRRLNAKTPCSVTDKCADCSSPDRICSGYVFMGYQKKKGRVKVILLDEKFGF